MGLPLLACLRACLLTNERARVLPPAGAFVAVEAEHDGELRPPARCPLARGRTVDGRTDGRTGGRPEAAVCGSGESTDADGDGGGRRGGRSLADGGGGGAKGERPK